MDGETTGVIISTGAFSALCTLAATWIKAKIGTKATIEPDPLNVKKVEGCITVGECNRRMKDFDERLGKLERRFAVGFDNILAKLDAMDRKSEERAIALNRRVDPIVEKVSHLAGQLETFKDLAKATTLGGKK